MARVERHFITARYSPKPVMFTTEGGAPGTVTVSAAETGNPETVGANSN